MGGNPSTESTGVAGILGEIMETKNIHNFGQYKNITQWFPRAIKIKINDPYAIHIAFFFEQVLKVLTEDDYPNLKDIPVVANGRYTALKKEDEDYELTTAILEDEELKNCKIAGVDNVLKNVRMINDREKIKERPLNLAGEKIRQNEPRPDPRDKDENTKAYNNRAKLYQEELNKFNKQKTELASKDTYLQPETTQLAQIINDFRQKIFQIQLKGATKREKPAIDHSLISSEGVDNYDELLKAIQKALTDSKCSYTACASLIKQSKKIFNIERRTFDEPEKRLQALEAAYDTKDDEKMNSWLEGIFNKKYGSMVSVSFNNQVYILVSDFIRKSFPFAHGTVREYRGYNTNEQFLYLRVKYLRGARKIKGPDYNCLSSTPQRENEIRYRMIDETLNLFSAATLAKTRLFVTQPDNWEADIKGITFELSDTLGFVFVEKPQLENYSWTIDKIFEKLYKVSGSNLKDDKEKEAFGEAAKHYGLVSAVDEDRFIGITYVKLQLLKYSSSGFPGNTDNEVWLKPDDMARFLLYLKYEIEFFADAAAKKHDLSLSSRLVGLAQQMDELRTFATKQYKQLPAYTELLEEHDANDPKKQYDRQDEITNYIKDFDARLQSVRHAVNEFIKLEKVVKSDVLNSFCNFSISFNVTVGNFNKRKTQEQKQKEKQKLDQDRQIQYQLWEKRVKKAGLLRIVWTIISLLAAALFGFAIFVIFS